MAIGEPIVQVTISLSESVIAKVDELLTEVGTRSRGALIDSLLRELLFDPDQSQDC